MHALSSLIWTAVAVIGATSAESPPCSAAKIPYPDIFGITITDLTAEEVRDYTDWESNNYESLNPTHGVLNFCNVTITHTHQGWDDAVHTYLWLPLEDWNGRFLGLGGGGWVAGTYDALARGISQGYASVTTDAGRNFFDLEYPPSADWTITSPGNLNFPLIINFAYRAVDDMTHIGKAVTAAFYGDKPRYSYWSGCSTGGRQGFVQAQRYPENYDGILSIAPAINFASFVPAEYWPQIVMEESQTFPPACEFNAITAAAIEACDELDGVRDGLVAAHGLCAFDPDLVVGQKIDCKGSPREISQGAVDIAKAVWKGPIKDDGSRVWYGMPHESSFSLDIGPFGGNAKTECGPDNTDCKGAPFIISVQWIKWFVNQNPDYDITAMTREDFFRFIHKSSLIYASILDTADPDLSAFRATGGKIIHWHGIADQLIFVNGSSNYYEQVLERDPDARDFYRYFEAPGVEHCAGGVGPFPDHVFEDLIDWVEGGKAPTRIEATTPAYVTGLPVVGRPLCPYPLVAAYKGGDIKESSSYECAASFDAFGPPKQPEGSMPRDEL